MEVVTWEPGMATKDATIFIITTVDTSDVEYLKEFTVCDGASFQEVFVKRWSEIDYQVEYVREWCGAFDEEEEVLLGNFLSFLDDVGIDYTEISQEEYVESISLNFIYVRGHERCILDMRNSKVEGKQ